MSLYRKARKLKNNPKQFFIDTKINKFLSKKKKPNTTAKKDTEPRVIGILDFDSKDIIKIKNKSINHASFSTLVLVDDKTMTLSKAPVIGELLRNANNFIGYREKTLFALRVKDSEASFKEIYERVVANKTWHTGNLSKFANVILVGKFIKYAEFFKSANPNVRIIAIVNATENNVNKYHLDFIDHLFHNQSLIGIIPFIKDISTYKNTKTLLSGLEQRILQGGDKPFDLLIPIFGEAQYISNIDELNKDGHDILIRINKLPPNLALSANSFSQYIETLIPHISLVLMRESMAQRYASLSNGKILPPSLLKHALKDGARVHII